MLVGSATATQAQSILETARPEAQGARGGFLDVLERQKTALAGSWLGTLDNGAKILTTFNADGTVVNSVQGEISANPQSLTHTSHHGVWRHLGGRQFGLTMWDLVYDINTGQLNLYTRIRAVLTLSETEDEVSGSAKVDFINPQGAVVMSFSSGLNYKRIKFEPLN
jgi:hypothetical protein